jgi:hypothetical protein
MLVLLPLIAFSDPAFESRTAAAPQNVVDDRLRYATCSKFVGMIERESHGGKSEAEIAQAIGQMCLMLNDARRNICTTLVPGQLPHILSLLGARKRPDFICEMLGFTRGFAVGRLVRSDMCARIVDRIKNDPMSVSRPADSGPDPAPLLRRPAVQPDEAAGESRLPRIDVDRRPFGLRGAAPRKAGLKLFRFGSAVCRDVEPAEKMTCHVLAKLVIRRMREELDQGASAGEICQKMQEKHLISLVEGDAKPANDAQPVPGQAPLNREAPPLAPAPKPEAEPRQAPYVEAPQIQAPPEIRQAPQELRQAPPEIRQAPQELRQAPKAPAVYPAVAQAAAPAHAG